MGLLPNTEVARQLDKLKIAFGKIIPKVEDILRLLPNTENARQHEKLKIALDVPIAIVDEILNSIHDEGVSETEHNKEMATFETISFEEQRIDEQLMDHNYEKMLSNRNDKKWCHVAGL